MRKKMKVGVIMGGISSELDISMMTGKEMLAHLNSDRYEVMPIVITHREELIEKVRDIDIALLALHGEYGEDGTVQGTLETLGIPYTGSGILSSSLCMNKDMAKKMLRSVGVQTPDWLCWHSIAEYSAEAVERLLGYPVIVKPNSGGSSIGIQLVRTESELRSAVEEAFKWDESVMLERYIKGEELTCSILNNKLLPIIGIQAADSELFDYQAKYDEGGAVEEVAVLSDELDQLVRSAALTSYQALSCEVYARVDMIVHDGIPYVLEVNTLPGMTTNSLLPKSAQAAGLSFGQLLDKILMYSLQARKSKKGGVVFGY